MHMTHLPLLIEACKRDSSTQFEPHMQKCDSEHTFAHVVQSSMEALVTFAVHR